ncbi:MAG: hypothetical protein ACI93R_002411 [Flavobacteriales bacterium]|jgi:hypothetical protein
MQSFSTQFTLSRDYLAECFDQSLPYGKNAKNNFLLTAIFLSGGMGLLLFTEQPKIGGSMLIALAALELIHMRYRRAWWLIRQMWGKGADSEVNVTIDDDGIQTQSPYTKTTVLWADIERIIETDLGLILVVKSGGQQYLSKSLFSTELIRDIISMAKD